MVYRFCVASDAWSDDAFSEVENSLAYAAYLLKCDPDAAALLLHGALPAMMDAWYGRQGAYPPPRDQLLRDLAERAPDVAASLRLALRAPDAPACMRAAQGLLAALRGPAKAEAQ